MVEKDAGSSLVRSYFFMTHNRLHSKLSGSLLDSRG